MDSRGLPRSGRRAEESREVEAVAPESILVRREASRALQSLPAVDEQVGHLHDAGLDAA